MENVEVIFKNKIEPFLKENYQFLLIGVGVLLILGAIFNWKWSWNPEGFRGGGLLRMIYSVFGDNGARISSAIMGSILVACGIILRM